MFDLFVAVFLGAMVTSSVAAISLTIADALQGAQTSLGITPSYAVPLN